MEILPNIHWLNLGSVNAYLCIDEDGLTLIDTGMPGKGDDILNYINKIGYDYAGLKRILITHADLDHAGSLAHLVTETNAVVHASEATAGYLREGKSPPHMPRLAQAILNRFLRYGVVTNVKHIRDGDQLPVLGGLNVVATPGHTLDHLSYYSPVTGALFAGDILHTRRNKLQLTPKRVTADMAKARQSARRLLALSPVVFACGHGTPMQDHESGDLMMLQLSLKAEKD